MKFRHGAKIGLLMIGFASSTEAGSTGALSETPPYFAPQFNFSYSGPNILQNEDKPECRIKREAEEYFDRVRKGASERGIAAETVIVLESFDARRFITAAWSGADVLPFAGNYADVDYVVVRTRPDLDGFAKVHFGSVQRGIICNFAHPVIITTSRMTIGLSGTPPVQAWPEGDPMPGMTQSERDAFTMLYGLRNQAERGNAEERAEALRGLGQLMTTPGMRADKSYPPDLKLPPAPKPRPEFEPTPKDVESILSGRPLCRDRPYVRNCITGR